MSGEYNDYMAGIADENRLHGLDLENERADLEPIPDLCEVHGSVLMLSGDCPTCLAQFDVRQRDDKYTPYKPAA